MPRFKLYFAVFRKRPSEIHSLSFKNTFSLLVMNDALSAFYTSMSPCKFHIYCVAKTSLPRIYSIIHVNGEDEQYLLGFWPYLLQHCVLSAKSCRSQEYLPCSTPAAERAQASCQIETIFTHSALLVELTELKIQHFRKEL